MIYAPGTYPRRRALAEEAVAMARRLSSPETLAATLQNYWLSIWAPGTTELRHRAYEELDRLGESIDDPVWHALAQPRRIVHAVECADIDRAWRVSEAFDTMAEDLDLPLVRWTAGVHRAGLLEVGGDLEGARQAADDALTHGLAAGQSDALLFHSVLNGMVQLWHDEYEALVETLEGVYQVFPEVPGLPPFLALMLERAGRTDDGMAVAGDLLRSPGDLAPDGTTLNGLTALADFINLAGSIEHAPAMLDVLRPNAATIAGNGVNWNESVAVRVGELEARLGNWGRAEAAFDLADDIARRMRAPLWQAIAAVERAWMHARRRDAGDRDRALELLDTGADLAEPLGARLLRHRCSLVLADLD
jgi:tetratricopeptide (TPR) repeat protein